MSTALNIPHNSFLNLDDPSPAHETIDEREKYRDRSRKYLEKCMQEIQYLLTPPPHPPPPHIISNASYTALPEPPVSLDELYLRQRQKTHPPSAHLSTHASVLPEQHAISASRVPENIITTGPPYQQSLPAEHKLDMPYTQPPSQTLPQPPQLQPVAQEEPAEHVVHSYDAYGRPVSGKREEPASSRAAPKVDPDGWNFDEQHILPEPPSEAAQPLRRPDTDVFPSALNLPAKSPTRSSPGAHRRRSSGSSAMARRRSSGSQETHDSGIDVPAKSDPSNFKVKFALRGHLDVVRSVIFTGGGSPSEPEICTAGDDGTIKRWIIPASYTNFQHSAGHDLDIACYFTHRGHEGIVTSLAACPPTAFATGGRASGDGWIFSGGQDATIRVWERGRVDPKAVLDGHTDAVWTVCVLPGTTGSVFGPQSSSFGGPDRILLASGSADGTVKIWAISAPPQLASPQTGSRRGVGGSRRHSVTSGSNHPSSPQPNTATSTPLHYTLIHSIERPAASGATPTCISPLGATGETFVVSYTDSSILIFDTRTGEELIGMASNETYDGTLATSINAVVATSSASLGLEGSSNWSDMAEQEDAVGAGPTGSAQGVEGVIISGHEDRYIRFFDANSGKFFFVYGTHKVFAECSSFRFRSMHVHHACSSFGHIVFVAFKGRERSRLCRPRRLDSFLVIGQAHMHSGHYLS